TRFPNQKFSVACLCNVVPVNTTQLALRIADLYLADQFNAATGPSAPIATTPAPISVTEEELKRKLGLYYNPTNSQLRRITLSDAKLRIDSFTPNSFELMPLSHDRFRHAASGNEIAFVTRPDGKLQLRVTTRQGRTEIFEPVAAAAPSEVELAEYVGSYFSEELDTVYHLRIEKGGLQFFMKDGLGHPMQPTFRDGFTNSDLMEFEFKRDAQGKITGFTLGMARLHNLIFARQNK